MARKALSVDDFRDHLTIDRDDLEGCLINHAQMFWQISQATVNATAERDAAKLNADQLHASMDAEIRETLSKAGKVTEAQIANAIKDEPKMQRAQEDLLASKVAADEWAALKEAFYQRGYMLRELVQLELRQYAVQQEVSTSERTAGALRNTRGEAATRRVREQYNKGPVRKRRAS